MNALLQTLNELSPTVLSVLAKGAAICFVAFAVSLLLRRSSASSRHLVWACAAVALLALPILCMVMPAWRVLPVRQASSLSMPTISSRGPAVSIDRGVLPTIDAQPAARLSTTPAESRAAANEPPSPAAAVAPMSPSFPVTASPREATTLKVNLPPLLLGGWAIGAVLFLLQLVAQLGSLRRLCTPPSPELNRVVRAFAGELPLLGRARLVALPAGSMPMTWGTLRPRLALPADATDWPADRLDAALRHELAHIARHDWAWLVAARIARALHWPNPLAWLVGTLMQCEQERAADDHVLRGGARASDYAGHLMALVELTRPALRAGIAMARASQVESRLVAILDRTRSRTGVSRRLMSFALLALCAIVVPIAALNAAAPTSVPTTRPTTLTTRPATMPSLVDTQYRELPFPPIVSIPVDLPPLGELPADRVALRVLDVDGKPVRIDRIIEAYFAQANGGRWYNGESNDVFGRYGDGWIAIDAGTFPTFIGETTPEVVFWSDGVPITARGSFVAKQRIECRLIEVPAGIGVDLRAGPADVAIDEVAGRVVDPAGRPVAGAVVSLPSNTDLPNYPKSFREPIVTDADGVFRFPDFARQWYVTCIVEAPGYATRYLTTLPIGRPFTVRLDDRTRLAGDLVNPDGSAASNATITLISRRSTWRQKIVSVLDDVTHTIAVDEASRYGAFIEPGEYDVRIRSESGVARHAKFIVRAGETQSLPRELTAGITARIRVLNAITREPVEGFRMFVEETGSSPIRPLPGTAVTTDADGRAEWRQLTEGTELAYADLTTTFARWSCVEAVHYEYDQGTGWLQFKFRPDMPELVILAEPAMKLTGTLVDPDGKPVVNAWVNVSGMQTGDMRYARRTDEAGRYTMYLPDKGSLRSPNPSVAASQPWGQPVQVVAAHPSKAFGNAISNRFDVRAGEARELNLSLARGGKVSGRVVDKDGKPVARIEVEAIIEDDSDTYYLTPRTLTDEEGQFTFPALRQGKYYVVADVSFGIGRSVQPQWGGQFKAVAVKYGESLTDLAVTHEGPPPPPVPAEYEKWMK